MLKTIFLEDRNLPLPVVCGTGATWKRKFKLSKHCDGKGRARRRLRLSESLRGYTTVYNYLQCLTMLDFIIFINILVICAVVWVRGF